MTTANKRELRDLEKKVDEGFEFIQNEFTAVREKLDGVDSAVQELRGEVGQMKAEILTEIRNARP